MSSSLALASLLGGGRLLIYFLTYLFIPIFLNGLGLDNGRIGVILSFYSITAILFSPGVGVLSDRMQIRWLLSGGFAICAVFYAALPHGSGFIPILLLFVLGGLGNSIGEIATSAFLYKSVELKGMGFAFALYQAIVVGISSLSMAAGGFLIDALSFEKVFLLSAAGWLLLMIPASLARNEVDVVPAARYGREIARREVLWFIALLCLFGTHWGAEQTCYALYLNKTIGLSIRQTGVFMGLTMAILAVTAFIGGIVYDRGARPLQYLWSGVLLSGLGQALLAGESLLAASAGRAIHEVGDGLMAIFLYCGVRILFPASMIGGLSAAITSLLILSKFTGALIYGFVADRFGYTVPLVASGLVNIIALVLLGAKVGFENIKEDRP